MRECKHCRKACEDWQLYCPDCHFERPKAKRGFALLSPEKRAEVSARGGRAAHAKGTAHEFTPEKAREAGRLGGVASHRKDKT